MVQFTVDGVLPPGIHEYNYSQLKEQFVGMFKTSCTREKILNGAIIFLYKICQIASPSEMWIDGSFVTNKVNPNDMDLVLYFDKNKLESNWTALAPLLDISKSFFCDAYIAIIGDDVKRSYWRGWFTYDRLENPKGAIRINPIEMASNISEVLSHA